MCTRDEQVAAIMHGLEKSDQQAQAEHAKQQF
jgi:hypothetical protein